MWPTGLLQSNPFCLSMIPCQLRPSSPTECGDNEEGDDAATEAPTMFGNETVVDPNEMEQNWYASRMQEVEEEWEWVKEEKVQKNVVEEVKKLMKEVKKEMEEEKKEMDEEKKEMEVKKVAPSRKRVTPAALAPSSKVPKLEPLPPPPGPPPSGSSS